MKIVLIAFRGTVAARVAEATRLPTVLVGSSERLIGEAVQSNILRDHDFIVGMGLFTHSTKYVHVESLCAGGALDISLADQEFYIPSKTIGNSWCNRLASSLKSYYPQKYIAFLHISSKLNEQKVVEALVQKVSRY